MRTWLLSILLTFCPWCCMPISQTSTPNKFTSADSVVDDGEWSNPSNASANDNIFATAIPEPFLGQLTEYLQGIAGIDIPVQATPVGIEVLIDAKTSDVDDSANIAEVFLVLNGAIQTTNRASGQLLKLIEAQFTFGGPTDLWDVNPSSADIRSSDFGVVVRMSGSIASATVSVDHVQITVYYTMPGAGQTFSAGSIASQIFRAGPTEDQAFTSRAEASQNFEAGSQEDQIFSAGSQASQIGAE